MRAVLLTVAALLVVTGLAAAAPLQQVTIAAQPPDLARDRRLTLYGSIPSARQRDTVVLQAKECGQSLYHDVARVTAIFGRYSWEFFYPGITAHVRAVWKGQRSMPVRVRDRAFVELRLHAGGEFGVSVRAKRNFVGKHALLQELKGFRWRTIRPVVLTDAGVPPGVSYVSSTGRASAKVAKGTLVRAVFPRSQARPCYLAGYSNMFRR